MLSFITGEIILKKENFYQNLKKKIKKYKTLKRLKLIINVSTYRKDLIFSHKFYKIKVLVLKRKRKYLKNKIFKLIQLNFA